MGYPYSRNASYTNPSQRSPFSSADQTDNKYQARRSNIPGQNNNYSNVIQNHALKDCQCLVSCTLDHKTITILIDTGSSISLLDEQLYCLLPFVPQLQPIQFSVSGADDRPLIALGITSLSTATDDNIFQVNVLLREISFSLWYWESTSCKHMVELSVFQLTSYTSLPPLPHPPTSLSMPIASTIHTRPHIIPSPSLHNCIPQPSYRVINTAPVTNPARTNTIMTIPCTLPRPVNYLFEPSAQNFADHPVHCTPVITSAANDNLPVHFGNHSDREVVVPKHTYVGAMEKVQELDRDNLSANATPEPVSQHALSECLAHSDLLPSQRQSMHTLLKENSGVFGSSIADLSSTPLVQHYIHTGNAKTIKQRAYRR